MRARKGYVEHMNSLTVSMPPALQSWIDARLAEGKYTDAADYLRDLVRRDRAHASDDVAMLRSMIEDGLASGIDEREPEEVLREVMARVGRG
ncbi:ribbon-helix-helix domain-containing protein [Sphingomonas radiodurans]|uniref:ribbon-helix-helix domain-containing protein n=1 Tax=Sphingomonas radiodurans TaxID=2890321 RepID=UPI001E2A2418|nr:type II toxin-antitoxin system ParD family antitoxin [Sphingomonas radiodurans]WBH17345.1 type II toxin-antitoxin system ParD family antitoxin [Sphingomonas radiodurans]